MELMSNLIESISMGPFGSDVKVKYFTNKGIPFLSGENLTSVKMNDRNLKYFPEERATKLSKAIVYPGDIVVTHRGTLGQLSYVPNDLKEKRFLISQSQFKVTLKTDLVNPVWFAYYFHTKEGQKRLLSFANYVGVPALATATTNFKSLEIPLPNKAEQDKIANILSSIDLKIANNNVISKELESMSKTIYDYWFLQFEFPDKDGKPYKSNGGKMVWNDQLKQEIPEGWEVKYLSDIESNIVTGKTPSTKDKTNFGKDVPFICIGDIRNHSFINSTAISLSEKGANSQKKKFIPSGSLCVSCIATPGLIGFTTKGSQTNQQINTIVFNNIKNKYFLYFALFEYFNSNKNVKTGNTFSNMNKEEFSKIKIIYNKKLVDEYFNTVNSYFEKIKLCEFENEQLQSLRDFLLPVLMNGQVIIED